ncbi:DUF2129 domain-containing protein [Streptococcus sp. NLN64]|uniref:DUF2129 domain-containing protein n=1 Tax=Streptococcus sp. NLN64 TaxID=2822799 RepID=UPI0018CB636B|nr:DUF2129 domain-containing protein [Streptococcus sp. NLN64]MBG9367111.1 DUF2129 domain-containing protein [Streptococcus sp. NLN64]
MGLEDRRQAIYVYLYYNRDRRKLSSWGDVVYHSRRLRYVQLFVPVHRVEVTIQELEQENYVRQVTKSQLATLPRSFQGIDLSTEETEE